VPLDAAITCANPFDWLKVDQWLRRPLNKHIYNFILTKSLVGFLRTHRHVFENHEVIDIDEVLESRTLQEYDEKITRRLWGYKTIEEYYDEASGKHVLENIAIPFLVLQSLDDPIIPKDVIPYRSFLDNPNMILATTHTGGHIAWMEGMDPTGKSWADHACVEFVHSILDHLQASQMTEV